MVFQKKKKKKKKRAAPLSSDKGSKGLIKLKDWQASLVTRLVQWGIPRCEMGQTTMQSLGDLSLNLAGSVKLLYMGNLKKENSHVIAK